MLYFLSGHSVGKVYDRNWSNLIVRIKWNYKTVFRAVSYLTDWRVNTSVHV